MKCIILPDKLDYDGSQISSLWAYNNFGVQDDSVVVFRGVCDVKIEHMIDLEDKGQTSLSGLKIWLVLLSNTLTPQT